ncbi:hypothetical protein GCM10008927_18210 [Amylibacter ulvae]|uniref:Uncharacterized protein n=1 Tax=Paramylibacter ulvae TaxID=1651968 RepID=A0ABQ3D235_9RHOB|nr:dimethylsulfonioproprionate lyase family protein [Amylibacter ulvae]GHA52848.1 hypothetical protein GCM10008927_18210 [Amylibacter ulvae]
MTVYKVFYDLLADLAELFDSEQKSGGHDAALALRTISAKSHTPLPPSHQILSETIQTALSINPHPICDKIKTVLPYIDWHWSGLSDGRIPPEIANNMATAELIGPDGMIFCEKVRVGLFVQSPNLNYVARNHAAEESMIILGGRCYWQKQGEKAQLHETGAIIHHPSNIPHASVTKDDPIIAAWRWTGDIGYDKFHLTG